MKESPQEKNANPEQEDNRLAAAEVDATKRSAEPTDSPKEPDPYELPSGVALTSYGTLPITRASLTRVVVLAGDLESGKTTLLSCIYEMFRDGPFAGMLFAGSSTLPAFEQRCHDARVESRRGTPETYRTRRSRSLEYLHLQLRDAECQQAKVDFLLSDITGELFEEACDTKDVCNELREISRADHFALLLDGKKLVDPKQRQSVLRTASQLLRRFLQEKLIDSGSRIDVLVSKWDVVPSSESSKRVLDFEPRVRATLIDSVGRSVACLRFHQIAARPEPASGLDEGFGVEALLKQWFQDGNRNWVSREDDLIARQGGREMSRYRDRRLSQRSPL